MYRVEVIVVDDSVPLVASDRPEVVKTLSVGSTYNKRALAEKFALRITEWGMVNEGNVTGKHHHER